MRSRTLALSALLGAAGCTGQVEGLDGVGGRRAPVTLMDTDGDGVPDAVDFDDDGTPELRIDPGCRSPLLDTDGDGIPDALDTDCDGAPDIRVCASPLVDADGDGLPEGVDLDCDGAVDIPLG